MNASQLAEANGPEFDHVLVLDRAGQITDAPGLYAPDVVNDAERDVDVQGEGWKALTGHTGQYGYNGAVMHPSEQWGTYATDHLAELLTDHEAEQIAFTVVEVRNDEGDFPEGDPIGWAIVYKLVNA